MGLYEQPGQGRILRSWGENENQILLYCPLVNPLHLTRCLRWTQKHYVKWTEYSVMESTPLLFFPLLFTCQVPSAHCIFCLHCTHGTCEWSGDAQSWACLLGWSKSIVTWICPTPIMTLILHSHTHNTTTHSCTCNVHLLESWKIHIKRSSTGPC